jgi:hypothetical protein
MNLAGRFDSDHMDYLSPEIAHRRLADVAGEDFGCDAEAWSRWFVQTGRLEQGEFHALPPDPRP